MGFNLLFFVNIDAYSFLVKCNFYVIINFELFITVISRPSLLDYTPVCN